MSKREIQLDVVSPSGTIFSSPVEFLSIMGPDGSIGILPGHVPVFMKIDFGFVEYQHAGQRDFITTMGGILEYHHNHATILTESAELATDIDEFRAKESMKKDRMFPLPQMHRIKYTYEILKSKESMERKNSQK